MSRSFSAVAKFYVTTSIPYVNAPPHIGHALEFVQADVAARRARLEEREVFFLTGTDEHGLKNWRSALRLGQAAQDFVDANAALFRSLAEKLDISSDFFIRTTDRIRHWPAAQKLWRELASAGDIYKKTYKGFYCVGHESFHPESELANGECPDYPGKELETVEEENYFFRLSKHAPELRALIANDEFRVIPGSKKNEILAFIDQGLEDVSFSRPREKLPWGVPVPDDAEQVMYVWCDALSNYLSGVNYAEAGLQFQKFWPPDLQVIGKDIVRFHALIWPAMLLSAKLPLPKTLLVHGFITAGGQKMSKTLGNVVDPFEMIERYGADPVRYFLLREIPATEDGDFTEEKLKARYNADLANGIGNLLARVLALGERHRSGIVLDAEDLAGSAATAWGEYERALSGFQFHEAMAAIWRLLGRADAFLNEKEPWKMPADGDELGQILSSAVIALAHAGWMLQPFLPQTAAAVLKSVELGDGRTEPWQGRRIILRKIPPLFPKKD